MYRQGLGDCFLVSLPRRSGAPFRILIDCGVILGTPKAGDVMAEVVCDVIKETDGFVDLLVVATSGTVGFRPTIAALEIGKPVALANKETLIMAGHLVRSAAHNSGAELLPIDSEHSAIWQCLQGEEPYAERVQRLLLTASGGAFRDRSVDSLRGVSPAEALRLFRSQPLDMVLLDYRLPDNGETVGLRSDGRSASSRLTAGR